MGGEFRMGNTCKSMADSCQCMAKKKKKRCPFSKAVQHPGIVHGILLNCSLEKDKLEEEGPWKGQVWIFVQDRTLDPKLPLLLLGTFPLQGLLID